VTLLGWVPLTSGRLTGKHTSDMGNAQCLTLLDAIKTTAINWAGFIFAPDDVFGIVLLSHVLGRMRRIRRTSYDFCTHVICKGVVPIPGARTEPQAIDNCGGVGWWLSSQEVPSTITLDPKSESFPSLIPQPSPKL
jgi:hypothetical protein